MTTAGLPTPNKTHAEDVVKDAIEIQKFIFDPESSRKAAGKVFFEIRNSVHPGPVVAGNDCTKKIRLYYLGQYGYTTARME